MNPSNLLCEGHNEPAEIVTHPRRYARCARHPSQRCAFFCLLPNNSNSANPQPPTRGWIRNSTNNPNNPKTNTNSTTQLHPFFSRHSAQHNHKQKESNPNVQTVPSCRCQQPAARRTVKKDGSNKGKDFFVCAKPQQEQCRFFGWADQASLPPPPPIAEKGDWKKKRILNNNEKYNEVQIVQRSNKPLVLNLEEIDTLVFTLHTTVPAEVKDAVKGFEKANITTTGMLGVQKVTIPSEAFHAFKEFVFSKAKVGVELSFHTELFGRIRDYFASEKRRERAGDVVTRSLDDILPLKICEKLMQFQWHGVHFALKKGGKCLIGDDMGLGKTLQAIAIARVYVDDWPLLIVCPSSLRLNWKEELLNWLETDLKEDEINVIMNGKDIDNPLKKVNIVSYDLLRKIPPLFLKRCRFIIADESHYLKTITAKRSKALTPMLKVAKRALLLSGTPALSRPVELFPQINAIAPVLFPNYNQYVERYCNAHQGRFGYDVSGASNLDELHTLLRGSVLIRRTKEEVLTQLPEKQRQVVWVPTKPSVMREVNKVFKKFDRLKQEVENAETDIKANILRTELKVAQNELYSLTATAKLDAIVEVCKDTADTGCKFIVFAHHKEVLEEIDLYISQTLKLDFIRIDGKTPQAIRQSLCTKFQTEESCRVALLSITAAGVGLTLTKASVVLFAELYWNPGSLLQAEDRAHRIGQRDCVFVKYLLARKTLDESMWNTVKRKLTVVGHSLTGAAGKMDVTEKKDKNETPTHGPLDTYFPSQTQATATAAVSNGVVDVDDMDEPMQSLQVIEERKQGSRKRPRDDHIVDEDGEIIVLDDLFPRIEEPKSNINQFISSNIHSVDPILAVSDSVDLGASLRLQEQMDADAALAKQLQEQYNREQALT